MQINSKVGQHICLLFSGVCFAAYVGINCANCINKESKTKWADLDADAKSHILINAQNTTSASASSTISVLSGTSIGIVGLNIF